MRGMAMGKRKRDRQLTMWVTTTDFPTAGSHPFYTPLNQRRRDHGFDNFAEAQCDTFYPETMGRPVTGIFGHKTGCRISRAESVAFVVLLVMAISCGLSSDPVIMKSVPSPDGTFIADYYQIRGGGALGSVADAVSLRAGTDSFRQSRDYVFGAIDAEAVELRWRSNYELEITYPAAITVTRT